MNEDRYMFQELHKDDGPRRNVTFGDASKGKVYGLGKVVLSRDNSIKKIMLVELLGYNLLSIAKLTDYGFYVLFTKVDCQVFRKDDYTMVFTGVRLGYLYVINFSQGPKVCTCLIAKFSYGWLCHRRPGHVGIDVQSQQVDQE